MKEYLVVDADAHVAESVEGLRPYLKPENRARPLWTTSSWDMDFGGTMGKKSQKSADPETQLRDMDLDGIHVQVIYPSRGLSLNDEKQPNLAVDVARAYNDWLAEFCSADPRRLKGVAVVALQDVGSAITEARRAVEELGHVGIMMPTNVRDQDIGKCQFWPFYEEVERLNVGLGLHAGTRMSERMHGRFDSFIAVHAVSFPFECMSALTGLTFSGVPEVFPKLRFAGLEAGCGWLPFLLDRLDEEFEKRGKQEAPLLRKKPSEYLLSGRFYFSFELDEATLPYVIERVGANNLLFSSDYPHWDTDWPRASSKFIERQDVTEEDKQLILHLNPQRFYGFSVDDRMALLP